MELVEPVLEVVPQVEVSVGVVVTLAGEHIDRQLLLKLQRIQSVVVAVVPVDSQGVEQEEVVEMVVTILVVVIVATMRTELEIFPTG